MIANVIMYFIAYWINLYPIGSTIGLANTYPLDSNLSSVDSTIYRGFKLAGNFLDRALGNWVESECFLYKKIIAETIGSLKLIVSAIVVVLIQEL